MRTYPYSKEEAIILQSVCKLASAEPLEIDFKKEGTFVVLSKNQYKNFFLKLQQLKELFANDDDIEELEKLLAIRKSIQLSKQQLAEGQGIEMTKETWKARREALKEKYTTT